MIDYLPLPYPSFTQSIKCYSDFTLLALIQRLPEVYKSLETECMYDIPQSHYEIWRAWSDWAPGYVQFMLMCYQELDVRGLEYDERTRERMEEVAADGHDWRKPQWVGWEPLHKEHQRYLLHIGDCERAAARICDLRTLPHHPANRGLHIWMDRNIGFRFIHVMNANSLRQVERRLHLEGSPEWEEANHYMQFDWDSRRPWHGFEVHVHEPGVSYIC